MKWPRRMYDVFVQICSNTFLSRSSFWMKKRGISSMEMIFSIEELNTLHETFSRILKWERGQQIPNSIRDYMTLASGLCLCVSSAWKMRLMTVHQQRGKIFSLKTDLQGDCSPLRHFLLFPRHCLFVFDGSWNLWDTISVRSSYIWPPWGHLQEHLYHKSPFNLKVARRRKRFERVFNWIRFVHGKGKLE